MLKHVGIQCYTTMLSNFTSVSQPLLHILDIFFSSLCLLKSSFHPIHLSIQLIGVPYLISCAAFLPLRTASYHLKHR